eukprot:TRINITY_DN2112_c0_g1_i5.p1 TRINITY_DN2112_c0_g1~~TRINITY_DN2112_c0_g1_i5.p1  ORF type:complete len:339 (-),score=44.91 TRINITY_DN2112_c0_g1_i5:43-1023(-)
MWAKLCCFVKGLFWLLWVTFVLFVSNVAVVIYFPSLWIYPSLFRSLSYDVGRFLWPGLLFCMGNIGGHKFILYGDKLAQENALLIANHSFWCDFISVFYVAFHYSMLGAVRGFAKESLSYVPFAGATLRGMGFVFVSRKFESDKAKINSSFENLKREKFWLFTHLEGSRFSEDKKEASHKFAEERNLPKLNHVLLPRVKGMVESIFPNLHDKLSAIYDLTIVYEKPPKSGPAMVSVGGGGKVHLFVKRIPTDKVPSEPVKLTQWLYDLYQAKDDKIEQFHRNGWSEKGEALPTVTGWEHLGMFVCWTLKWLTLPLVIFYSIFQYVL